MANRTDLDVRPGSSTKIRAEQIKSELALGTLAGDIEALAEQIGSVIGAEWKEEQGSFDKVQLMDLAVHLDASDANKLVALKNLDVNGQVTGSAARVENLTAAAGAIVVATGNGDLFNSADLKFQGGSLSVVGQISGSGELKAGGLATLGAGVTVNGGVADFNAGITANDIKIDSDVVGRLYRVGPAGEVMDEQDLFFAPGQLTVTGSVVATSALKGASAVISGAGSFGGNVSMANLTAASGSFSGDVSVSGDLKVMGAMTYLNTENLLVKDAKIVISSGSIVNGAGIYLGSEGAGENIRWDTSDDGKWVASDKFAADELQALDLSSALVWADATGSLKEVTAAQFATYLAAGFGIDSVANGTIAATEYTAGTGVSKAGFQFSIGQAVGTTDAVTFAAVTGSNLTASRLMASNGSKGMVSADLFAWVAGTEHKISVADDNDGSITLSLPLAITETAVTTLPGSYTSIAGALKGIYDSAVSVATKKAVYVVPQGGKAADADISGLWLGFLAELTSANEMIFVNGQLMDATGDYTRTSSALSFKFALEEGDVVTVKKA